jgi:hypothetical protein
MTIIPFGAFGMNPDIAMFAQVMVIIVTSIASLVVIALGARILWRVGSRTKPSDRLERAEHDDRLRHLETAVDSIAIEVERISEAQRFMVGLLGDPTQTRRVDPVTSRSTSAGRTNTPH